MSIIFLLIWFVVAPVAATTEPIYLQEEVGMYFVFKNLNEDVKFIPRRVSWDIFVGETATLSADAFTQAMWPTSQDEPDATVIRQSTVPGEVNIRLADLEAKWIMPFNPTLPLLNLEKATMFGKVFVLLKKHEKCPTTLVVGHFLHKSLLTSLVNRAS